MEKLEFEVHNRLIENKDLTSTRTNNITSNRDGKLNSLIESTLKANADIIEVGWERRHAKLCYDKGIGKYIELADKARKYGKNPKALLACLVSKELNRVKAS